MVNQSNKTVDKSIDDELSEVLLSISQVTKRLAEKFDAISKSKQKGENNYGKNEPSRKFNRRSQGMC